MMGTTGALILVLFNFVAGGVIGLLAPALILRKRLTFLRGLASLLLSAFAFLIAIACLTCSYFQNGVCGDPTHSNFRNQLANCPMLTAIVVAGITSGLLSIAFHSIDRDHRHDLGTN